MFCESCGSRIPDGSKFCTECGARVAVSAAEVILPDIPDVILPEVPDVPDVILPGASVIPDISPSILHDSAESAGNTGTAEPAWCTGSQTPAAPGYSAYAAPYPSAPEYADASSIGYSTVDGYSYVPADVPDPARRPLYKRWWFWLILILGIGAFLLLIFAALIVYSMRNTMPPIDDFPPEIETILSETEDMTSIDQLPSILENTVDVPEIDEPFPLDADDRFTPMEILTEQIGDVLTEMELEHEVYADDEDWVFIDVWTDGLDVLAEAAYEGDEASCAEWDALTENVRVMSEDFLSDLLAGGQHSAVCVVSLLDDADTDLTLAVAIDGELILDLVSGLDVYGIMEE